MLSQIQNPTGEWATAGLTNKAYVDGAISTLSASFGNNVAYVTTEAGPNGTDIKMLADDVWINADNINLSGQTNFIDAIGNSITVSNASVADSVVVGEYGNPGCTIKTDNNRAV